jgi:hypothetical protein
VAKREIPMFESDASLQMAAVALEGKHYAIDEDTKEKARQINLELFKKYFKD